MSFLFIKGTTLAYFIGSQSQKCNRMTVKSFWFEDCRSLSFVNISGFQYRLPWQEARKETFTGNLK